MKLPRWLVVTLLGMSMLAVLCYAGWWWVMWPHKTMAEVRELFHAEKLGEALTYFVPPPTEDELRRAENLPERFREAMRSVEIEPDGRRTVSDILLGRLRVRSGFFYHRSAYFIVHKGKFIEHDDPQLVGSSQPGTQ
jgi:hypothetical protein